MSKQEPPAVDKTAFTCPHCLAYTTQHWHEAYAHPCDADPPVPFFHPPDTDWEDEFGKLRRDHPDIDAEKLGEIVDAWKHQAAGDPELLKESEYRRATRVINCNLSSCWHCKRLSLWIGRRLIYPIQAAGALPNQDLPAGIAKDFEEARLILNTSPRGAAALLRLCVEKLCNELGAKGRTLDDKIGYLVSQGLDDRVKDALDVVRVIGNGAVHDGKIDDGDADPKTAIALLELVNEIAIEMLSKPRRLAAMKAQLPAGIQKAIERRDSKARPTQDPDRKAT